MERIWMGIDPRPEWTRILVMSGPERAVLKARLSPFPSSRQALPSLLEAIAMWQGSRLHAALVVDESAESCRARFARESFAVPQSPLFALEYVTALRRPRRRRDGLSDMGRFEDLRQLLLFEAMR